MTEDVVSKRDFSTRVLLAVAGFAAVAVPVMSGLLRRTQSRAESRVQNTSAAALQYEVASIKPNKYSSHMLGLGFWIERFTATGVTLQGLIREAYEVEDNQISGAPPWLDSERYDIEAKADKSVADELLKLSFDQRVIEYRRMLRTLLADRLKLTLHSDPVLDKTGLTGKYDFTLEWTPDENRAPMFKGTRDGGQGPDNPPDSSGPSIFTAIQEQLGLKLEAQKGPAEMLVIDHVERPSEN